MYRGFKEMGAVWVQIGTAGGRADVVSHGRGLAAAAPGLYAALHTSLAKTTFPTVSVSDF